MIGFSVDEKLRLDFITMLEKKYGGVRTRNAIASRGGVPWKSVPSWVVIRESEAVLARGDEVPHVSPTWLPKSMAGWDPR